MRQRNETLIRMTSSQNTFAERREMKEREREGARGDKEGKGDGKGEGGNERASEKKVPRRYPQTFTAIERQNSDARQTSS